MSILSYLPARPVKPRKTGITMVMDKGMSLREAEDFISVAADLTDFVKLGFGTSVITPRVKDKIRLYKEADIRVYAGGTLFEAFLVRNAFDDYRRYIGDLGLDAVEISDGSMKMDHDLKCSCIQALAQEYLVLSEVGSKEAEVHIAPDRWTEMMQKELQAGSFKVIAEARESGTVGIYKSSGSADTSLIDTILGKVDQADIIWEAPLKSQQAWFIRHFGANVNLGNIAPSELIPLETLRLGLRGDTFFEFLPENLQIFKPE